MCEKWLLKQAAQPWLPEAIRRRPKRPYRAPVHRSFFNTEAPDYVRDLLAPAAIKQTGLFKPAVVEQFVAKLARGTPVGETDDMALVGILSTQLLYNQFIKRFRNDEVLPSTANVKVCCLEPEPAGTIMTAANSR
jgi:asparagine synthase (glutamine-hydrolysing)